MPDYGQCSEPSCTEIAGRLFDCTHHCMKLVCLQHLIEHDRLIAYNQDYLDNLRTELKSLWSTYLSLIDETKIRFEFEQKLKKHQQFIRDISNLFEINSVNIEHYRFMVEKLKQNIEQINQNAIEAFPHIEQIKNEPIDEILTTTEHDSLEVDLGTRGERLNSDIEQQKRKSISDDSSVINDYDNQIDNTYESRDNETVTHQTNNCRSVRKISGVCPFWLDGAFGLTEESHGMYLCSHRKSHRELYRHLIKVHKLKISSVERICQAIQNKEDPLRTNLFRSTDTVIDQINHFQCPFSIYNDMSTGIDKSSERRCRTVKPQFSYTLRYHLTRVHQMTISNANKVVYKLKTNSKLVTN